MKGDFKACRGKDVRSFCRKMTLTAECVEDEILMSALAYYLFPSGVAGLERNRAELLAFMRGPVSDETEDDAE